MASGYTAYMKVLQQKVAEQLLCKRLKAFSSCKRRH